MIRFTARDGQTYEVTDALYVHLSASDLLDAAAAASRPNSIFIRDTVRAVRLNGRLSWRVRVCDIVAASDG